MNKFIIAILLLSITACERKAFVEHKIKREKLKDGCVGVPSPFKMTSNFGGERFEFAKCMPVEESADLVTTERRGDTVLVRFKNTGNAPRAVYQVTLDIDSYPKYSFITIDEDTYTIIPTAK